MAENLRIGVLFGHAVVESTKLMEVPLKKIFLLRLKAHSKFVDERDASELVDWTWTCNSQMFGFLEKGSSSNRIDTKCECSHTKITIVGLAHFFHVLEPPCHG